jgi:large subunit ribosomal protein L24
MKRKFSTHWNSSTQPRKQRKYAANAPLHLKKKLLTANLSKELRKKHNRRNIVAKKGDTVKIMKGKFKNKHGKIISIDVKTSKIKIEGIMVKKQDGSKVGVKIHPSNLQIIELNLEDKRRIKTMNKDKIEKAEKEAENKKEKDNKKAKEESK